MKKIEAGITVFVLLFSCGCGLVGVMGTPTRHEKKIPAEYDLAGRKNVKIAIWVESSSWANIPANFNETLREYLRINLREKLKISSKNIVENKILKSALDSGTITFGMDASEIGKAVNADLVLFVQLQEFSVSQVTDMDYYKGRLAGRVGLFETSTGQRLWPITESGKRINVLFDVEKGGYTASSTRLLKAFAHCTTRYLYDCPVEKFKIFEDKSSNEWENWQN